MTGQPVEHATLVIERTLDARVARVFAAWSDPPAASDATAAARGCGHARIGLHVGTPSGRDAILASVSRKLLCIAALLLGVRPALARPDALLSWRLPPDLRLLPAKTGP